MNFVYIFLMVWGCIFGGVPLALFISGEASISEQPFLLIFVAVGLIVFIIGLRNVLKGLRLKRIRKKGTQTMGMYLDSASNVSMNGVPLYYIRFSFVNENGTSIEVKTPSIYTIRQAEFYEKLGRFEIKYINNIGVITQGVDYRLLDKMKKEEERKGEPLTPLEPTDDRPTIKQGYYFCDYCGNEQEKPGKCKSCGAKITSKNYRER